jgi:hypothetical protein
MLEPIVKISNLTCFSVLWLHDKFCRKHLDDLKCYEVMNYSLKTKYKALKHVIVKLA